VSHTTLFKPRPGTRDQFDRQVQRARILQEVLPPFIFRRVIHRLQRFGF
jgi:hypothetical protein